MEKTPTSICSTTMGTTSTQNQPTAGMAASIQRVRQERIANEILMYFRAQRKSQGDLSLSDSIDGDGDGSSLSLMDTISVDDNMLEDLDARESCVKVRRCVRDCLDSREAMVITLRYGLNGAAPMTQREIATRCGISRSYVSRRH